MTILQIKCFARLANNMHLTKTAQEFNISASTLSKYIDHIEKELGAKLFVQSKEGLKLTEEGEVVYPYFQYIAKRYDDMKEAAVRSMEKTKHVIRVAVQFHQEAIISWLLDYQDRHPDITISITETSATFIQNMLDSASVDLAFMYRELLERKYPGSYTIYRDSITAVVSRDHPLACRKDVDLADLKDEKFIFFNGDMLMYRYYLKICITAGFVPDYDFNDMRLLTILEMVGQNLGVTLMPERTARLLCDDRCVIIPLKKPEAIRITAFFPTTYPNEKCTELLVDAGNFDFAN